MPNIDLSTIISELPSDPEFGLIKLGEISRRELSTPGVSERDQNLLAALILKYTARHDLLLNPPVRIGNEQSRIYLKKLIDSIEDFKNNVFSRIEREQIQVEIDSIDDLLTNELPFGQARLTVDEKVSIRSRIENIKTIISASNLTVKKKNALMSKLNSLLNEVDRDGTRTDAFFAFAADVAMVARDLHEKSKPIIEDTKDILRIVYSRRAKTEGSSLPDPDSFPQLPANFDEGSNVG